MSLPQVLTKMVLSSEAVLPYTATSSVWTVKLFWRVRKMGFLMTIQVILAFRLIFATRIETAKETRSVNMSASRDMVAR